MSAQVQSKLEKRFKTTTLYKRSRQYFDIGRLNKLEQQQELSRRKPNTTQQRTINNKFSESFYSADLKLNERVQTELSRFQTRALKDDDDDAETDYSSATKKAKTLDMSKMLPRSYFSKTNAFTNNQNHFCNFRPYLLPHNNGIYFEKFFVPNEHDKSEESKPKAFSCMRCKSRRSEPIEETPSIAEPEIGKIRQKLIFDESIFRTLIDFRKYDKERSERKEEKIEKEIDLERIKIGEEVSQKRPNLGLVQFYHGDTKWAAPQMDNRLIKQNEYWLKQHNKEQRRKIDWTMQKRKADLIETRKTKILERKHIPDVKGQFCDEKYFRRNFH